MTDTKYDNCYWYSTGSKYTQLNYITQQYLSCLPLKLHQIVSELMALVKLQPLDGSLILGRNLHCLILQERGHEMTQIHPGRMAGLNFYQLGVLSPTDKYNKDSTLISIFISSN